MTGLPRGGLACTFASRCGLTGRIQLKEWIVPSVKKPAVPEEKVQCAVCGKEIPHSAAVVPQNKDYVYYYCSVACSDEAKNAPSP